MNTANCIQWLWKISHGFRTRIALNGVIGVLHVLASLVFVAITKKLIDIATGNSDGSMSVFIFAMLVCITIQILLGIADTRISICNTARLKNFLRHRLFVRSMESRWTGREKLHTGDVLNRLEDDVRIVSETLCSSVPDTITTVIQLLSGFTFLMFLEPRLAWTLLFIMPVALVMSKAYIKKMRKLTKEIRSCDSRVQSHLQEHLQHRTLILTLEQSAQSATTLSSMQNVLFNRVMRRTDFSLYSRTAVQVGFAAGYATAFLWGIFGIRSGTVTFGMMTAFLQLVIQVQRPVVDLSSRIPGFVHSLTSVERLAELDNLPQEDNGSSIRLDGSVGIRMSNVYFSYPDSGNEVISDFTHDFKPGSITGVVGETGAGKSTLVRLILSLLHPQNGTITIYNKKTQYPVSALTRCNMVYVPQGNTLMSGSILDNLCLGNPNATDTQIREALHTAVADFVYDLPDGLNTICGEHGNGLSEGQAQRIAISRGLLRDGCILLLDEPTSALDSETSQRLMERLKKMTKEKTVIVITHSDDMIKYTNYTIKLDRVKSIYK